MTYKKIIASAILITALSAPIVTSASSMVDLQARIQSLLSVVASLQQQLATNYGTYTIPSTTTRPWWCSTYSDLSYGQYNNRVMALHNAMGYSVLGAYPTGYYGNLTYSAWSRWCGQIVVPPIIYPTTNLPPTISSFSGPTMLDINQVGTWTVYANDPENGQLTYTVTWGDEYKYGYSLGAISPNTQTFTQSTSFTHQYSQAGTYTVSIVVRDNTGQEARTTITVRVSGSGTVCTLEYNPVCGQPPYYCPPGAYCTQVMPTQRTYGNICQLNADSATLVHYGVCTSSYYQ